MKGLIQEAEEIYTTACKGIGNDAAFTEAVALLVGKSSEDYEDLAMRFDCEAKIMLAASRIAKEKAVGKQDAYGM